MTEQYVQRNRALTSRTRILTLHIHLALVSLISVAFFIASGVIVSNTRPRRRCDAESLLHHIDPLIAIDLERGLGVQLLVRTTRSVKPDQERSSPGLEGEASLTITSRADESELLVFDLP